MHPAPHSAIAYKRGHSDNTAMSLYKIIGGDQKEYGPSTDEELRQWIDEGRLNGQSLARLEGESDWRPLSTLPEFSDALKAQAARFAPPPSTPPPLKPQTPPDAEFFARPTVLRPMRCLRLSWELMTANLGLFFSATSLVWLCGVIGQLLAPLEIVYWLIQGVLYGGLYLIILKRIRGQPAMPSEIFSGFRFAFAQLALAGMVISLLTWLGYIFCLLPGIYLAVIWALGVPLVADKGLEFWSAMELSRKVVSRVWFEMLGLMVLAFLPYLVAHLYAQANTFLATYSVMQGVVSKGPPDFAHLMDLLTGVAHKTLPLVMIANFVLLANLPFALGALMYAYEDLFGPRTTPGN
jgi:GYF domain 2